MMSKIKTFFLYTRVKRVSAVNIKTLAEAHHHYTEHSRNTLRLITTYYVCIYWVGIEFQSLYKYEIVL